MSISRTSISPSCANGSTARFVRLLTPAYPSIKRYALHLAKSGHDAEDVLQESLVRAWENIDQLRSDENFKMWVIRIIKQVHWLRIRKHLRREGICPTAQYETGNGWNESGTSANAPSPASDLELRQALATLTAQDRSSLLLSVLGGFTVQELSGWQEIGVDCMKKRMERIRKRVRNYLHDGATDNTARLALTGDITVEALRSIDQFRRQRSPC
jgi:RNA polymerase sigma factor (sigma-70 family)